MKRVEALVQAGGTETPYVRAGCGSVVVLLEAAAAEGSLFDALAARFRVVAPRVPEPLGGKAGREGEAAAWLWEVLDGLGLERCGLVMEAEMGRRLAPDLHDHGGRLSRVVVLDDGRRRQGMMEAVEGAPPCLRLAKAVDGAEDGSVAERVAAFLRDGPGGPDD